MSFHHLHWKHFNLLWIGVRVNLSNPRKKTQWESTQSWGRNLSMATAWPGGTQSRSFFGERFENWGLPWRISHMAPQPLRVLPWRVRQENFHRTLFLHEVNTRSSDKFCLKIFQRFQSFHFSVRCLPCRRTADKGESHQPPEIFVQKLQQRCSYPASWFTVSRRHHETTSLGFPWKAS